MARCSDSIAPGAAPEASTAAGIAVVIGMRQAAPRP
jgi:hypothetical protein